MSSLENFIDMVGEFSLLIYKKSRQHLFTLIFISLFWISYIIFDGWTEILVVYIIGLLIFMPIVLNEVCDLAKAGRGWIRWAKEGVGAKDKTCWKNAGVWIGRAPKKPMDLFFSIVMGLIFPLWPPIFLIHYLIGYLEFKKLQNSLEKDGMVATIFKAWFGFELWF